MRVQSKLPRSKEFSSMSSNEAAEIPAGWTVATLSSLCERQRGVSYGREDARREPSNGFVPILRANNIDSDRINFDELVYVPRSRVSASQRLRSGDVIVAMSSGSKTIVGKAAQLLEEWDGSFGAFCGVLRPNMLLNSRYVGLFLSTREYRQKISNLSSGTNINNLKADHFDEIELPVPPLAEQRRIVAKLDKLLGKVSSSQQRLARIPGLLKRFRQSVLAAACSGKLTADWREENDGGICEELCAAIGGVSHEPSSDGLPASWRCVNLERLSELITKGASPKWQGVDYVEQGVLFVTSENIGIGRTLLESKKYVQPRFNEIQPRSILRRGDVLTTLVGASIGRTAIFESDELANINQAVGLIRLKPYILNKFIMNVLNSPKLVNHMHDQKVDVARANVSLKDVRVFPIPLPPLPEQQEIVRRVEKLFAFADRIEARLKQAQSHVDRLTQSILAKAFRGELVPQDPNDEPASELLRRIRVARVEVAMSTNKNRKRDSGKRRARK
jgi:type I restriction enzyme S subunit